MGSPTSSPPQIVHVSHLVLAVDPDVDAITALRLMRDNRVRHLPVINGNHCVGLLTDRDVLLALAVLPTSAAVPTVGPLCHGHAPVVDDGAPLSEVAAAIVAGGMDAALVVRGGVLTGIVTTSDVLAAVAAQ